MLRKYVDLLQRLLASRSLLALATVLVLASSAAAADEKWIELFDGKTLTGWHKNPQRIGHGTGGNWTVVDGAITGEQDPPGSGNGGILLTDRKFANFEVSLELKPDWGCDSGFFVRGNDRGQCFQVMVDYHEAGNVGHIYGEGTGGFNNRPFEIFGKYDENKKLASIFTKPNGAKLPKAKSIAGEDWVKLWKVGDWNSMRVRVVGNPPKIESWINGRQITEFDGATYDGPGYNKAEVAKTLGDRGSIAVQVHGGSGAWPKGAKCRWKNIKIRELE
jgi:hypothetical protein